MVCVVRAAAWRDLAVIVVLDFWRLATATSLDTPSASLCRLPGLCSTWKRYSDNLRIQRIRRDAGPPSMVSRIV